MKRKINLLLALVVLTGAMSLLSFGSLVFGQAPGVNQPKDPGGAQADLVRISSNVDPNISPEDQRENIPEADGFVKGIWATNAPIPVPNGLSQTTSVAAGGLIYEIGGGVGLGPDARINQVWAYDPATDMWTRKADIPVVPGLSAYGAAVHVGESIYVVGGLAGPPGPIQILNTLWIYDIANDSWSRGADLPGPRFGAAVAEASGKIIIAGGSDGTTILNTTLEYDPATDSYAGKAPLPMSISPPFRIHATTLDNLEVHVFAGGFGGVNHLVYDVVADSWSMAPRMPIGVTDPGVVTLDGLIFVLGGSAPAFGLTQIYRPESRTWTGGPFLPHPVDNTSAAVVDNTIHLIGGFNGLIPNSIPTNYSLSVPPRPGRGVIVGQVTDSSTGNPIPRAVIQVVDLERRVGTDANGEYTVSLPAGKYMLTATAFGFQSQATPGVSVTEGGVTRRNFALHPVRTRRVSGVVTRADGMPIENAQIRFVGTPLATRTDAAGMFVFPAVPEGTYQIQVIPGRRCFVASLTQQVTVDADTVVNFTVPRLVDGFGYSCDDEVTFNWIPGETLLPLTGDDDTIPVTLPFPFTFYGQTYTVIHVSTNGFGNFLAPNATFSNVPIPSPAPPNAMVAPLWDDLDVIPTAGVFTKTEGADPNRQFIIEWRNVIFFGAPGVTTFEMILEEATGSITFQYNRAEGDGDGRSATVGIENQTGMIGLQYSFNEAAITVNKAIKFFLAQ